MSEEYKILDVKDNISFHTIYEAINYCMGTHYTGWMKACWPKVKPENDFRMWFPKLSPFVNGEYVSLAFDCINYLSTDWNELVFDDLKDNGISSMDPKDHYWGNDLIFAKEVDGDYLFRGVFIRNSDKCRPKHHVNKRIATRVKLIGNPVYRIELLDSIKEIDINTPMSLLDVVCDESGVTKCKCVRCGYTFVKASRCPECGQLFKL